MDHAIRAITRMVQADRKTVTKVIQIAKGLGLTTTGDDVSRLNNEFVGEVMTILTPPRPDRHDDSWALLVKHRGKVKDLVQDRDGGAVPAVKIVELLARQAIFVPERTLNRFIATEFTTTVSTTVPLADGEPGEELQGWHSKGSDSEAVLLGGRGGWP